MQFLMKGVVDRQHAARASRPDREVCATYTCENSALPPSATIRLLCWKAELTEERAAELRKAGFTVDASPLSPSRLIGDLKRKSPAAVVIDLDRLPSHGRIAGAVIRSSASTRHIPLVFAGGIEEKTARVREELPDAAFAPWKTIGPAVRKALKNAPVNPVKPRPHMERYQGSGLSQKLGLKSGLRCALIHAPEAFEESIDGLPEDFAFQTRITAETALIVWFVRTAAELVFAVERSSLHMPANASVWLVYPKRSGAIACDFTLNHVREAGMAAGMVDYKICAVDADWTGMKFARRKK